MPRPQKIHIAGAGLVGSLLAVMLGNRGYDVSLIERRSDPRLVETESGRSINLALAARGIAALKAAGLMEKVKELLIPMKGRMLHLEGGSEVFSAYGQRPDEVIYSISRGDLNVLMMDKAEQSPPVNVQFNQKLETIDFERSMFTARNLRSGDSHEQSFELFIGADGAGSKTRRMLIPANGGQSTAEFLDHDYKELEIPAGSDASYQIEPNALHIWPRGDFMLIALPNQNGSFTVTLFLPKEGPVSFQSLEDPASVRPFFEKYFPSAIRLIPNLMQDFADNPVGRLGTVRCSPWYQTDKALILGDASHAIVPFHGQGMNAGFEDCSELNRLLDKHDDDWTKVLPEFDRIRRPNAEAIADMAIENYVTMRSSVTDPKFQLKKEVGFELEKRFPDRFMPRYSMVMFHLIPYADAFERGQQQRAILNQLVEGKSSVDAIDFDLAKRLIQQQLLPMPIFTAEEET